MCISLENKVFRHSLQFQCTAQKLVTSLFFKIIDIGLYFAAFSDKGLVKLYQNHCFSYSDG